MNLESLMKHNARKLNLGNSPTDKALSEFYIERYRELAHMLAKPLDNENPKEIIHAGKYICDNASFASEELLKIYKMLPAGKAKSEIRDYFITLYAHCSKAFKHYRNNPYGFDGKQKEPN